MIPPEIDPDWDQDLNRLISEFERDQKTPVVPQKAERHYPFLEAKVICYLCSHPDAIVKSYGGAPLCFGCFTQHCGEQ